MADGTGEERLEIATEGLINEEMANGMIKAARDHMFEDEEPAEEAPEAEEAGDAAAEAGTEAEAKGKDSDEEAAPAAAEAGSAAKDGEG